MSGFTFLYRGIFLERAPVAMCDTPTFAEMLDRAEKLWVLKIGSLIINTLNPIQVQ